MLKVNWVTIQDKLKDLDIKILTPLEFKRIFDISERASQYFLEAYTKKGIFFRLKKGLYGVKFNQPSLYQIANKLYQPSYISFESALSYYSLIPEKVFSFISSTTKPTREFACQDTIFNYHNLKKEFFTGYAPKIIEEAVTLIAEPEKALADCLYLASFKKRPLPERVELSKISMDKVNEYLKIVGIRAKKKILSEFLERNKKSNAVF